MQETEQVRKADLEADAILPGKGGRCHISRLISGVVADFAAGLPRVHPVSHLIYLQLCISGPLKSEGYRIIQQNADSLQAVL